MFVCVCIYEYMNAGFQMVGFQVSNDRPKFMGSWHTKKYLDGQMKGIVVSQNILGLPKQILMAL